MNIELTQGFVAIVDDDDAGLVERYRWKVLKAAGHFYACRSTRKATILMHRAILGAPPELWVDHRNGNGLDNRRSNLRLATARQNTVNRRKTSGFSSFKGVYWNKERSLWQAQIGDGATSEGRQKVIYLGRFESEEAAARAYDAKALEMHGEFANLNFPGAP